MFQAPTSINVGMPTRRLEDRIRELCGRALFETGPEWQKTVHELQLAIHEHVLRKANLSTAATDGRKPGVFIERRYRPTRSRPI